MASSASTAFSKKDKSRTGSAGQGLSLVFCKLQFKEFSEK